MLSPLRIAQDQAIIAGCLATAMAAGGERFTAAPDAEPQLAFVERARAMRLAARHQCEIARAMRADNDAIVRHMRTL